MGYCSNQYLTIEQLFAAAHMLNYFEWELNLDTKTGVLFILDEVLSLNGRTEAFSDKTLLLGAIPELDSMAVVSVIAALEEKFDITVDDDEIDGATFATLGSLIRFVEGKIKR